MLLNELHFGTVPPCRAVISIHEVLLKIDRAGLASSLGTLSCTDVMRTHALRGIAAHSS